MSASGYYKHERRAGKPPSGRLSNDALLVHIKALHAEVMGEYGWRRIRKELLARVMHTDMRPGVLEEATHRTWKIPYVSIEAAQLTPGDTAKPYDPPPEPARRPSPTGFAVGDRVTFDDSKGGSRVGVVATINRRTATIVTDTSQSWRVDFPLLRHIVEV